MPATVDAHLNLPGRLRALPQLPGEPDGWAAVRRRLGAEVRTSRRKALLARYSVAASVAAGSTGAWKNAAPAGVDPS